ncbi:SRPBCC family protein [Marinirhabdus gelatinilytica]|uniref:Effector-binding domain-containing protein n=1 Tax=Marinirhabdus gelatinilytica TaxID=1703343 RepID=A0A370Q8R1_9FLAO|nr:SRPBCC family protein [Marinirhabdus gelatinilytica]RDK84745.1 effector-binding domain-containing protein [Marinirhabdus gelatinilytica]
MKILKYLFFLILIFLIGGAIYFATKDGSYDVARTKTINAPAEVVYNNVKDFKTWQNWGPWMAEDENIEINYAEKTQGEGASYSWKSDVMGDGSMKTTRVIPNKEMEQKIVFNTPLGDSESDVYWKFEEGEEPSTTKVTWGMKGELSFMDKVFMSFQEGDFETSLSSMYDQGLENLDQVVMEEMKKFEISVDGIAQHGGGYYMYNTISAKMGDIGAKMGAMMGQVMGYMQSNNIAMTGKPFALYNQIDEANGTVIFSAGIPVRDRVITPEGSTVVSGYMEPVSALKTTLKGGYDNIPAAYAKAQEYMQQNGLTPHPTAKMFEVYVTDPNEVPNPANYVTEIYMPVLVPEEAQ